MDEIENNHRLARRVYEPPSTTKTSLAGWKFRSDHFEMTNDLVPNFRGLYTADDRLKIIENSP